MRICMLFIILNEVKDLYFRKIKPVRCEILCLTAQNDSQTVGAIHESPVGFDGI